MTNLFMRYCGNLRINQLGGLCKLSVQHILLVTAKRIVGI